MTILIFIITLSILVLVHELGHFLMAKKMGVKVEEKKLPERNLRDDSRRIIKIVFEKKEMSEDEKYRLEKEIDAQSTKFMEEITVIRENKEKEIMEV